MRVFRGRLVSPVAFLLVVFLVAGLLPIPAAASDDYPQYPDAFALTFFETKNGCIETIDDQDWFSFQAVSGVQYDVVFSTYDLDGGLFQLHFNGTTLEDDDFDGWISWTAAADVACYIEVTGSGTGEYQLEVAYTENPELSLNPTALDFGSIEVDHQSGVFYFTLQNTGSGTGSGYFAVEGDDGDQFYFNNEDQSFLLEAGQSMQIGVFFKPYYEGLKSAILTAYGDDGDIVSADLSGLGFVLPMVVDPYPVPDEQAVFIDTPVMVFFNVDIDPATLTPATFLLTDNNTHEPVAGSLVYDNLSFMAVFTPEAHLHTSTTYTALITTGVASLAGYNLPENYTWSFTTLAGEEDLVPPVVDSTYPPDGEYDVPLEVVPVAFFSEEMDASTITPETFSLWQGDIQVPGEVNCYLNMVEFYPRQLLAYNTTFTTLVTTGVTDLAGNHLLENYTWNFTTLPGENDIVSPEVSLTDPADSAVDVPLEIVPVVFFSEELDASTITPDTFTLWQGDQQLPGEVNCYLNMADFVPQQALQYSTTYTALITTGVTDLAGNHLLENYTWSFTTLAGEEDLDPPVVDSSYPPDGEYDVYIDIVPVVIFSEEMDASTITPDTFTLWQGDIQVSGSVIFEGYWAEFQPQQMLANNTTYTALITTGVTDLAGNHLLENYTWSFTTLAGEEDLVPPEVSYTYPSDSSVDVSIDIVPVVVFNEDIDGSTITPETFLLWLGDQQVSGEVNSSLDMADFVPQQALQYSTTYTAMVTTCVTDLAGNHLLENYTWSFTTLPGEEDIVSPEVSLTDPPDSAVDVPLEIVPVVFFSEEMDASTITPDTFTLWQGDIQVSGSVIFEGYWAEFQPQQMLANNTTYTALITTGVTDLAGNHLPENFTWSFTTAGNPQVVSVLPADNSTGIAVNTHISAVFSEAMDFTTITTDNFSVMNGSTLLAGSVSYDNSTRTAVFTPAANLSGLTRYTARIYSRVADLDGNHPAENHTWSFTTINTSTNGGGGNGGGGGGTSTTSTVTLGGLTGSAALKINSQGVVQNAVQLKTPDSRVSLVIPSGTKMLTASGQPLAGLSATVLDSPPPPSNDNHTIVLAYTFGPEGAAFTPAFELSMAYDPSALPEGVQEDSLFVAYFDGTQWQTLEGKINAEAHTVTIAVSHFSRYALIGKKSQPAPVIPSPTTTPKPVTTAAPTPTATVTVPASPTVTAPSPSVIPASPASTTVPVASIKPIIETPATPLVSTPFGESSSAPAVWIFIVIGGVIVLALLLLVILKRRSGKPS